ncbi:UNVERIFIED_CONTAM: hypothetical protein BEN50_17875 [Euhalothece sp. KZN 001]
MRWYPCPSGWGYRSVELTAISLALVTALLIVPLPLDLLAVPVEASVPYFHLYTGFRVIAIVVALLVAAASSILIARRAAAPPGTLRRAAAVAIVTAVGTPPVVALLVGVRALLPGAIPLVTSVPELLAVVAVGGWLSWSPVALALMGPLLMGVAWWQSQPAPAV